MEVEKVRSFFDVDENSKLWDCGVLLTWVLELKDGVLITNVPNRTERAAFACEITLWPFPDWILECLIGIGNGTITDGELPSVITNWLLVWEKPNFARNIDSSNTTCLNIIHFLVCVS